MAILRRASPMPSAARRASIVAAALPLLRSQGAAVTTAQIAAAAGIAEGTLFRVFPDKDALIAAAIETAFDPAPAVVELRAIDRRRSLRDKLIAAVEILERRVGQIWQLMSILGLAAGEPDKARLAAARGARRRGPPVDRDVAIRTEIASILADHRDELRFSPPQAMRLVRMMTFANHPRITDNHPLTAAEIVDVLLDGIRARPHSKEPT